MAQPCPLTLAKVTYQNHTPQVPARRYDARVGQSALLLLRGTGNSVGLRPSKFQCNDESFRKLTTFFCFLNVNAQVHALTYHVVRLGSCVSFVTYYLIVLHGINKAAIRTYSLRLALFATLVFKKLKGEGSSSPSWTSMSFTLTVRASSLAGVPVCNLPSLKPALARDSERPRAGESPILPAGKRFKPEKRAHIYIRE